MLLLSKLVRDIIIFFLITNPFPPLGQFFFYFGVVRPKKFFFFQMSATKKRVLSIDLGTKNLAFCVLERGFEGGEPRTTVLRWGILNVHGALKKSKKTPTISELNRALQETLAKETLEEGVDLVAIENQPAGFHKRANTKMKTLSHCIEAYMWHRLPSKQIRFVNPKSKFSFSDKDEVARVAKLKKSSERYKEHKRMACEATQRMIESPSLWLADTGLMDMWTASKKKDDLADCFLQGLYVLG